MIGHGLGGGVRGGWARGAESEGWPSVFPMAWLGGWVQIGRVIEKIKSKVRWGLMGYFLGICWGWLWFCESGLKY